MVLILGDGFVAKHLSRAFENSCLLKNFNKLEEIIKNNNIEIIINTIGILKEDKYTFLNSHVKSVEIIVNSIKNKDIKLIHFSALGVESKASNYYKSKLQGEEIITKHLKNYLIIRPSIILGGGQKLYDDLKKLSFLPFLIAPKGKVAPIHIDEVIIQIKNNLQNIGIIKLCGKVLSYKELFEMVLEEMNIKKKVIEVNRYLLLPMAITGNVFKFLPINIEQWKMLKNDNVC